MYNFNEQLALLNSLGVVGVKVLHVPNGKPEPGQRATHDLELAVVINSQGFIGEFNSLQKLAFALAVEIERRNDLHVVWAEGQDRGIKILNDQTPAASTAFFVKRIPTDITMSGEYVTKNTPKQGNGIWVISTTNGQLQMWEVAIVTILKNGKGRYYLSLQKVYEASMYACLDGFLIHEEEFPGFHSWESLRSFLLKKVSLDKLKPYKSFEPEKGQSTVLADSQAEVIWFNQAKGFGFARVNGEETNPNFHRSEVLGQEFPAFQPGQIIRYSSLNRTPRGVQLTGVTE